jgi:hypothetical protein
LIAARRRSPPQTTIARYPKGNKSADATLKAELYGGMGQPARRCAASLAYPTSDSAAIARERCTS